MTLHLDLTPKTEAWIYLEAQQRGLAPIDIVRTVIEERAAAASVFGRIQEDVDDRDPTIALLQSWINEDAPTNSEDIREAEEELNEFKRNMNAPRRETGMRLLFPEVE